MQDTRDNGLDADFANPGSASGISFLAALPYRRSGPIFVTAVAVLLAVPFLFLVFFSPSLFVTDPAMEVLSVWLDARAIVVQPPSLAVAAEALAEGRFLYLMLVNAGAGFAGTPGESLLIAQALMALVLILPLAYGTAMRLPTLPAIALTLFVVVMILVPAGGILTAPAACSVAVFLWLSLITYGTPHRSMLTCAQIEGVLAGLGLWFLYMTATPLFLAGFAGFIAALVLQDRRGLIFTLMALATFLVLGASADLLAHMTLGVGLVGARLGEFGTGLALPGIELPHVLAVLVIFLGFVLRQQKNLLYRMFLVVLLGTGSVALSVFGVDCLPLLLLVTTLSIFGQTSSKERQNIEVMSAATCAGTLAIVSVALALSSATVIGTGTALFAQYERAPLQQAPEFGFSFATEPKYADLILARKLDPSLVAEGLELTPADQAVLIVAGLDLAKQFTAQKKSTALVSAGDMTLFSQIRIENLEAAQIVITPKLAIDRLTDEARVNSQSILYTEYKRAARTQQVSPVYDIWVRR